MQRSTSGSRKLKKYFRRFHRNHRILDVGRDLWRLSSPASLFRAGPPEAGCWGMHPGRFWIAARTETPKPKLPNTSEQLVTMFDHPQSKAFLPIASGHHWKKSDSTPFIAPYQAFIHMDKSSLLVHTYPPNLVVLRPYSSTWRTSVACLV